MQFLSNLFIKLSSNYIGQDGYGNKYYESKKANRSFGRKARYVIFLGEVEASKVPSNWFNWLHYQSDDIPKNNKKLYKWEKSHEPNLSGTKHAYYPSAHSLSDDNGEHDSKSYTSWSPN